MAANTYRPLSERAKLLHGEDVFEAEFSATEERDHLDGGHLEIVPRPYKVLSANYSAGKQGAVVDLALLVEHEAALTEGGHIERAERPTTKKKG
jgi:hypothetical protein